MKNNVDIIEVYPLCIFWGVACQLFYLFFMMTFVFSSSGFDETGLLCLFIGALGVTMMAIGMPRASIANRDVYPALITAGAIQLIIATVSMFGELSLSVAAGIAITGLIFLFWGLNGV